MLSVGKDIHFIRGESDRRDLAINFYGLEYPPFNQLRVWFVIFTKAAFSTHRDGRILKIYLPSSRRSLQFFG